jgi:hypothetical protein
MSLSTLTLSDLESLRSYVVRLESITLAGRNKEKLMAMVGLIDKEMRRRLDQLMKVSGIE